MNKSKKIGILGGGLAGTFLAAALCRSGHQVTLVDDGNPRSASRTAAGLFNVVTGRHSNKTWMADELLSSLMGFFAVPEFQNLQQHLIRREIYRPFREIEQVNTWSVDAYSEEFKHLVQLYPDSRLPEQLHNPLGGLGILPCGWLETGPFLQDLKQILVENYALKLVKGDFDYGGLAPESCVWEGEEYDDWVFAEGVKVQQNPWMGPSLDLRPLKGQVLEVEIPDFEPPFILSRKVFLIPRGGGRFTCGSTYERHFQSSDPTPEGIEEISSHLRSLIKMPFTVLSARAAIRPTSPNRRPILGTHPTYRRLHILNGMGTKGVLHAPWCALQMNKLLNGEVVNYGKDVDLKRFFREFS